MQQKNVEQHVFDMDMVDPSEVLQFLPNKQTFKQQLLKYHHATKTIIYKDGHQEISDWNASNYKTESDLINNIRSGPLRDWKKKGITKAIFEVREK